MDLNLESYAQFNERRDDPIFLEFLLENHEKIINQKDGVEKILYSMEISRLLARVAVHERCEADYEKRRINQEKYEKYHRTALFVARKGIDIGIGLAYDAHDEWDDELYFLFNYYMSWLHIQYSMMLTETQRYFAAMSAIVNAENYFLHDYYEVLKRVSSNKIIEMLKKMPDLENKSFYLPKELSDDIVRQFLQLIFEDLIDAINEKKLRILYKIYKEVPDRYHELYAGYICNLLSLILERYGKDKFMNDFGEVATNLYREYPNGPSKDISVSDFSLKSIENLKSQEEQDYNTWAVSSGLVLSYLDFVPSLYDRLQYICDDLVFDFHTSELNLMMEDIMETFAHCRFQIFFATRYSNPVATVAYSLSPKAKRIFNHEVLLDVYPRLYSLLDKISHIVIKISGIVLPSKKDGYPPQPSYSQIVKEIRNHSNGNPYLLTLCEIFDEINPRYIYNNQNLPFYAMLPEAEHMDRIRHHIIHSGISLTVEDSGKKSSRDMCYITEREFGARCCELLRLVKEAIMNTCFAIEYRDRHE